jgi:hypothetical protein
MVRLLKSMFAFVIVATVLCMNTQASHAYQTGDSKWCVVMNKGADSMQWECEYDTSDECATGCCRHWRLLCNKSVLATGSIA